MDRGPTGKTIWQLLSRVAFAAIIAVGLAIPVLAASGAFSVPAGPGSPDSGGPAGDLAVPASAQGGITAFVRAALIGDVDCAGDVDAVDALFILQNVAGLRGSSSDCPPPSGPIFDAAADADCDGDIDAVDALFVLQHVAGLRPELCPT